VGQIKGYRFQIFVYPAIMSRRPGKLFWFSEAARWKFHKPNCGESGENPHYYIEVPLHSQKIGVWAAISRRRLIGPIFFEGKYSMIYATFKNLNVLIAGILNAERYRLEIWTPLIETLLDDELTQGYFQQDGARIHTTWANLNFLMEFYDNRLISLNMPHEWPPRSCDLTPCDFFLWPYIKKSIFSARVVDMDDLRKRTTNKFEEINNSQTFSKLMWFLIVAN
jgi:hypothetical protein